MLVASDTLRREYKIGITETTDYSELAADCSYLVSVPNGKLTFDFTYTASNLTYAIHEDHLPGHFGFHATDRIIDQLAFVYRSAQETCSMVSGQRICVVMPSSCTSLGSFYHQIGIQQLLETWNIPFETRAMWEPDGARDDLTRRVILGITEIAPKSAGARHDCQRMLITRKIEEEVTEDGNFESPLRKRLVKLIADTFDYLVLLTGGGLALGIYYPLTGHLEMSIGNHLSRDRMPNETDQLEFLVSMLEAFPEDFTVLQDLVSQCFGSLQLSCGFASLVFAAEPMVTSHSVASGLPEIVSAFMRSTAVMQLPPEFARFWSSLAEQRARIIRDAISR